MSAWGAPPSSGAWAAQVDEEEEANGGELAPVPVGGGSDFPALGGSTEAFPSLGETAATKETKKERKKRQQKMSLGAFVAAGRKEPEIVNLPTAPRARPEGTDEKGLGGGFKNYGGDRGSYGDRGRDRDDERSFRRSEDEGPSRADAAEDWGTKKAFVPSGPSRGLGFGDRERDRGGGFGDRYTERRSGFGEGDPSRADDADRWESKSFEPSARKGGFDDRERQPLFGSSSRADTEDRWSRRLPLEGVGDSHGSGGLSTASSSSRPRLNLKPRSEHLPPAAPSSSVAAPPSSNASEAGSEDVKPEPLVTARSGPRSNPFGAARPVDIKQPPEVVRETAQRSPSPEPDQPPAAPKPRANPFGSARPREDVLREKGLAPEKLDSGLLLSSRASEGERSELSTPRAPLEAKPESQLPETPLEKDKAPATISEADSASAGEAKAVIPDSKVEETREAFENGASIESVKPSAAPAQSPAGTWAKIASKAAAEPATESEEAQLQ